MSNTVHVTFVLQPNNNTIQNNDKTQNKINTNTKTTPLFNNTTQASSLNQSTQTVLRNSNNTQGQEIVNAKFDELTAAGKEAFSRAFNKETYGERALRHSQQFLEACQENGINPTSDQSDSMKYYITEGVKYAPQETKESLLNNLREHFQENEKLQNLTADNFNRDSWREISASLDFNQYINDNMSAQSAETTPQKTDVERQEEIDKSFNELQAAGDEPITRGLLKGIYGDRALKHSQQFLEKCQDNGINPSSEQISSLKDYIYNGVKYASQTQKETLLNNLKEHFPQNSKLQSLTTSNFNRDSWGEIANSLDFNNYIQTDR